MLFDFFFVSRKQLGPLYLNKICIFFLIIFIACMIFAILFRHSIVSFYYIIVINNTLLFNASYIQFIG